MDDKQRLKEAKLVRRTITDLIERIEADLAKAEEKPKLRHGDYGPAGESEGRLVLKEFGKNELRTAGAACCAVGTGGQFPKVVLGNIFDDLTALQEDVEDDYKVKCRCNDDVMRISIDCACPDNDIMFAVAGKSVHVDPEDIHGLILKLRQMEATLQRKQK